MTYESPNSAPEASNSNGSDYPNDEADDSNSRESQNDEYGDLDRDM